MGRKLQILSDDERVESHQLDLLSFVSDYALADISIKEKQARTTLVKNNITKTQPNPFQGNVDKNKTFANFSEGDSNQFAVEAVKRFLDSDKSDYGMFYLKAGSGLGKSHVLHAIANELKLKKKPFYLSSPLMMSSFAVNLNAFKSCDFVLIDDIEEIEGNSELEKVFCQLIDYAQSGKTKLVVAGAKFPKELSECGERFRGKLSAALIHNIFEMNNKLALSIVEKKCLNLNLSLPQNVKELVSRHCHYNVYGLESVLHKLKSINEIQKRAITLELAMKELPELKVKEVREHADYQNFLKTVANHFHISYEDLMSHVRKKEFALARHVAMFILKEKADLNLVKVGEIFSRDHTSVIYAVARVKEQLTADRELRKAVQSLMDGYSFPGI